ncbi:MAG: HAMP domain-containing histidine kinase [Planctomycetes bacterium]|nr:HAMP domain-containing histidine kinase [Planctomycetota bacterium]
MALLQRRHAELQRKLIERTEALLEARNELRVLDRMKRDFIVLISHEMRTPLTSVLGMADLIRNGLHESPEDLAGMATAICDEAQRLARFVDDVVEFLQWASGQASVKMAPLDLVGQVQECVARLQEKHRGKGIAVVVRGEDGVPMVGDLRAVQSCIERILDNAMKFSEAGGTVEVTLERREDPSGGGQAVLRVRDHGQGIAPEHIEDLGKPMTLCHGYNHHSRGCGMGLAIAHEILRAHGGRLRITSPGKGLGTEAVVTLPLRAGAAGGPATGS